MATSAEKLEQLKGKYLDALLADAENPKPDYSIDGQSVSRSAWRKSLLDQVESIDDLLIKTQGPFEVRTTGVPL